MGRIEAEQQRNNEEADSAQDDVDLSGDNLPVFEDEDSVAASPYTVHQPYYVALDSESFQPIEVVRRMKPLRYPIRVWNKRSAGGVNFYGMRG